MEIDIVLGEVPGRVKSPFVAISLYKVRTLKSPSFFRIMVFCMSVRPCAMFSSF